MNNELYLTLFVDEVDNGDAFVYECCHTNEIHILDGIFNGQMNCVMHG
jgi:hypothetical protein